MQKTSIHETLYSHGLCATCRSAPSCTFQRRADEPVMDCLEFDGELRKEPSRASHPQPRRPSGPAVATEPGMCAWCDHRATCTFPRNAGGIWLCEEYQ